MNPYNILIVEDEVDIARAIEVRGFKQGRNTFSNSGCNDAKDGWHNFCHEA